MFVYTCGGFGSTVMRCCARRPAAKTILTTGDDHGFRCAREVVLVQLEDEAAGPSKWCDSALRAGILQASGSVSPIAVGGAFARRSGS